MRSVLVCIDSLLSSENTNVALHHTSQGVKPPHCVILWANLMFCSYWVAHSPMFCLGFAQIRFLVQNENVNL